MWWYWQVGTTSLWLILFCALKSLGCFGWLLLQFDGGGHFNILRDAYGEYGTDEFLCSLLKLGLWILWYFLSHFLVFLTPCNDHGDHALFCSVHLVELRGTGMVFAMKAMDKSVMMNRNKVYTMSMNWNFHKTDESRHTYFNFFQSLQVVWQFFCPRRCTEHALKGKSWNLWTTHSFLPYMLRFRFLHSPTSTSIIWLL